MLDIVYNYTGFNCIADDDGNQSEQAVATVLNHFKSVAAAWRDILPLNAYCRSLG